MEARTNQALTLLAGLRDRNSPLSVLNAFIVRKIMRIRSRPIHTVKDGSEEWRDVDTLKLHNRDDKPAVVYPDGTRYWYKDGIRHRDGDEPAWIYSDGSRCWFKHGVRHRDGDEPAVIEADGTRHWFRHGVRHRDGDEPAMIEANGTRAWYKNGAMVISLL